MGASAAGTKGWRGWVAGCLLGTVLVAGTAYAAPLPIEGRQVDMTAREQPIAAFLQDFSEHVEEYAADRALAAE